MDFRQLAIVNIVTTVNILLVLYIDWNFRIYTEFDKDMDVKGQ